MKIWKFDIGLEDGRIQEIEAPSFEVAFAKLHEVAGSDGNWTGKWSLVGFNEKRPEPTPTEKELKKKSEELWAQVSFAELAEAEKLLRKNFANMQSAVEFDEQHPSVCNDNPMAHSNDVCQLKHAEKCIDEFMMWFEY